MPGFAKLIDECGLTVVESRYTQGAPFWTISILDWLHRRRVVRRRDEPLYRHPLYGPLMAVAAAFDFARAPVSKTSQMMFVVTP